MPVCASIERLPWESEFFALSTARLHFRDDAPALELSALAAFERVQAKIPCQRGDWLDALWQLGFQMVEGECDFTLAVAPQEACVKVRLAAEPDIAQLREKASQLFRHSRFRAPWYAEGESGRFYACWVENAVRGRFDDQCLLLPDTKGGWRGFVTLRKLNDHEGRIGLLAGRGAGEELIQAARYWCAQRGLRQLWVATQIANLAAMRRYIASGGSLHSAAYWLYK